MDSLVLSLLGVVLVAQGAVWYKLGRVEAKLDAHCQDVPHKE